MGHEQTSDYIQIACLLHLDFCQVTDLLMHSNLWFYLMSSAIQCFFRTCSIILRSPRCSGKPESVL